MAKLNVTVGLPCSGKSDYVKMFAKETGTYVVNVGDTRKKLREEDPDVSERVVFAHVFDKVRCCLAYGYDCILDGTFIRSSQRGYIFEYLEKAMPGIPYEKVCVVIATPIEKVFYNNISRGEKVPNEIIGNLFKEWQTPGYWEGWNEIWMYYENPAWMGLRGEYGSFAETHTDFDLSDKDHFDSLGGHCNSVHNHLLKLLQTKDPQGKDEIREKSLLAASLIHDCGKPIVETRQDGKSLYYNHANVGAYEAMFYSSDTDVSYVSNLINHHMDPYDWNRAYAVKKFGGEFVEDLSSLHQADEMAKGD